MAYQACMRNMRNDLRRSFRVIIFSGEAPQAVARIASRVHMEVPEAQVCGILHRRHPANTSAELGFAHVGEPRGNSGKKSVEPRSLGWLSGALREYGAFLLRIAHACPPNPNGSEVFDLEELSRHCDALGCSLLNTEGKALAQCLRFVRNLRADLGVILGSSESWGELLEIPRLGSIGACGPGGSEEGANLSRAAEKLCDDHDVVTIALYARATNQQFLLPAYEAEFPLAADFTAKSLALKRDLVAADLVVRAVGDFSRNAVAHRCPDATPPHRGSGRCEVRLDPEDIPILPQTSQVRRGRPVWKLMLRTILWAPWVVVRNWTRRLRGRFPVVILFFHLVSDRPHRLGISTEQFLRRVDFLRKFYRVVSLREAVKLLESGKVGTPTVVLTFDDGYGENFINLRAVAERTRIPVTLFVSTEHVTTKLPFQHDVRRGQSGFVPLSWEQVISLARSGFEIGSHTRSHFDCGASDKTALESEIVGSKNDLERRLGTPVEYFSFPWGYPQNMSPEAIEVARKTYAYILSAHGGVNFPSSRDRIWHLRRCGSPPSLWELELTCQSILDR